MKTLNITHDTLGTLRTVSVDTGDPWFIAKDLCEMLGHKVTWSALEKYVDEEDKAQVKLVHEKKVGIKAFIVNEAGALNLIMASPSDRKREIKNWIVHDILPKFRQERFQEMFSEYARKADKDAENAGKKKIFEEIYAIRSLYSKSECDWRSFVVAAVKQVAIRSIHKPFTDKEFAEKMKLTWQDVYSKLELRTGISLKIRQTRHLRKTGHPISKIELIEKDIKIKEIFVDVVRRAAISWGLRPENLVKKKDLESLKETTAA